MCIFCERVTIFSRPAGRWCQVIKIYPQRIHSLVDMAWPGFDSRRHMWIEFVVRSCPCSEGFSPGPPVSFIRKNQHFIRYVNSGQEEPPAKFSFYLIYFYVWPCSQLSFEDATNYLNFLKNVCCKDAIWSCLFDRPPNLCFFVDRGVTMSRKVSIWSTWLQSRWWFITQKRDLPNLIIAYLINAFPISSENRETTNGLNI